MHAANTIRFVARDSGNARWRTILPDESSEMVRLRANLLASFHLDSHAHPRMDAALKKMFTLRQTRDLGMAALKDSGLGYRDLCKAAGTFGNRALSWRIKPRYKTATEPRHLGKSVRLAALVDYDKDGSLRDVNYVRFEVPARVRSSSGCFLK